MNFSLTINKEETALTVFISGEVDVYTAPQVKETVEQNWTQEADLTIDLHNVSYMDSTGLGVLVGAFKQVTAADKKFQLVGVSDRIERLFSITGLADIMDIKPSAKGEEK